MPMFTAIATLPGKDRAESLCEALEVLEPDGVGVFEIEDGSGRYEVAGYFAAQPDGVALALLAAAHGAGGFVVSAVPQTDWVAHVRRELAPVEAGRFFVHGSHDSARVPPGREALLIEAAMAFGTGHHGSTQGCLLALDRLAAEGFRPARVADIGCGTAVLAMAAARLWPAAQVLASDLDPVAVEVAQANLAANRLAGRVECLEAEGFGHPRLSGVARFDLVLANILKGPLVALAPSMADSVAPGGRVVLSGILDEQVADVVDTYINAAFTVSRAEQIREWATLTLARRDPGVV